MEGPLRREAGCGTALTELTGNLLGAQGMLRHKTMTTTASFYKKKTPLATLAGMKMLEAVGRRRTERKSCCVRPRICTRIYSCTTKRVHNKRRSGY
jgi:hypothetical protein